MIQFIKDFRSHEYMLELLYKMQGELRSGDSTTSYYTARSDTICQDDPWVLFTLSRHVGMVQKRLWICFGFEVLGYIRVFIGDFLERKKNTLRIILILTIIENVWDEMGWCQWYANASSGSGFSRNSYVFWFSYIPFDMIALFSRALEIVSSFVRFNLW